MSGEELRRGDGKGGWSVGRFCGATLTCCISPPYTNTVPLLRVAGANYPSPATRMHATETHARRSLATTRTHGRRG